MLNLSVLRSSAMFVRYRELWGTSELFAAIRKKDTTTTRDYNIRLRYNTTMKNNYEDEANCYK
jgi:1,2-phenylacetyl-CoA epoxidase catalytic subunit